MRTRRQFVTEAALALAAVALRPAAAIGQAAFSPTVLNYATFAPLVLTRFRAVVPSRAAAEWVLIKAQNQAQPRGESFSLIFRAPAGPALDQGTYGMEHERLGAFDLFVVPKPADHQGCYLEAVFNRIA